MKKGQQPRQSRAKTHFKFYSEKFLFGSTRSELEPDERAVWVDFLCLASLNLGEVECFSRDQLAHQLYIDPELLNRSIDKFISCGKVKREFLEEERREIFQITKWNEYQADYLKKRIARFCDPNEENRIENLQDFDADNQPILEERIEEDKTQEDTISEENTELESEDFDPFADSIPESTPDPFVPNISYPSHDQEENPVPHAIFPKKPSYPGMPNLFYAPQLQDNMLSILREIFNYPFNKSIDQEFVRTMISKYPGIDHIAELQKKIEWWEKNPDAIRNNPRKQLEDWFQKEYVFQKRKSP